jgi:hypothetical protein
MPESNDHSEDPSAAITSDPCRDGTQGREATPYEDAAEGIEVGSKPYEDATHGREVGSSPDEDATHAR